jgi:hypothetical protein
VGLRLCEQRVRLGLKRLYGIGACSKTSGRLRKADERHQSSRELGGVPALFPVHALPGDNYFLGLLGIALNSGLSVGRRVVAQQLGAEESRFDEHRANSERGDLRC